MTTMHFPRTHCRKRQITNLHKYTARNKLYRINKALETQLVNKRNQAYPLRKYTANVRAHSYNNNASPTPLGNNRKLNKYKNTDYKLMSSSIT